MTNQELKAQLLDAILPHVAFDGWSKTSLQAAATSLDLGMDAVNLVCPRGAVDLALAYHERGDLLMVERINATDFTDFKFRDKVARALSIRLEVVEDKEAVRRAATLFALPHHAADSARAVWQTADRVWYALEDRSEDYNWYTKRATLSGVWASVVLYWLGDDSLDMANTRAFIDRRIGDVMQFEKVKARLRNAPIAGPVARILESALSGIKPPIRATPTDYPGSWSPPKA